jgi:hypothetical protein
MKGDNAWEIVLFDHRDQSVAVLVILANATITEIIITSATRMDRGAPHMRVASIALDARIDCRYR